MYSAETPTLHLPQWTPTDHPDFLTDINGAFKNIDDFASGGNPGGDGNNTSLENRVEDLETSSDNVDKKLNDLSKALKNEIERSTTEDDNFRALLNEYTKAVTTLSSTIEFNYNELKAMIGTGSTAGGFPTTIAATIAKHTVQISNLQNDINDLDERVQNNTTNFTKLSQSVSTLSAAIDSAIKDAITLIEQDVDEKIKPVQDAVNSNAESINNLSTQQSTNTTDISSLKTKVATNTTDISSIKTNVANNTTDISGIKTTVSKNTTDISDLITRITTDEDSIGQNTREISSIETEQEKIRTNLDDIQDSLTKTAGTVATQGVTIENLQSQVQTNKSGLASLKGTVDAALPEIGKRLIALESGVSGDDWERSFVLISARINYYGVAPSGYNVTAGVHNWTKSSLPTSGAIAITLTVNAGNDPSNEICPLASRSSDENPWSIDLPHTPGYLTSETIINDYELAVAKFGTIAKTVDGVNMLFIDDESTSTINGIMAVSSRVFTAFNTNSYNRTFYLSLILPIKRKKVNTIETDTKSETTTVGEG